MKYGFLAETGDVGQAEGATRYLIVAVVITSNPHRLRKAVIKTRKGLRKKLKQIPELKAKRTPKKVVAKLLRYIAMLGVEIVAVILDKESRLCPFDPEDWYRTTCARAARHCLEQWFGAWLRNTNGETRTFTRSSRKRSLWRKC
ncbi:MAG: hypothetical protein FJ014_16070 [Chloroflexi bacterium]|nr:hypothetical protein [Chloroflexota bacterium]